MGVCSFSRAFKAQYGLTFRDYLLRFRIGRACELLRQGVHSATDVGLAVGFEDPSHFARAFRRVLGICPSSYQRRGLDGGVLNEAGVNGLLSNSNDLSNAEVAAVA